MLSGEIHFQDSNILFKVKVHIQLKVHHLISNFISDMNLSFKNDYESYIFMKFKFLKSIIFCFIDMFKVKTS